jgi:CDP-6-deoxy-D-xylo-4-hexulose-3-dehydrase
MCKTFEEEFSKKQKRKFTVLVNSGSSANLVLLQALKSAKRLRSGDYVAFSSITWSTNVMPIMQMGFRPYPVDVSLKTINVSSAQLWKALKENPRIRMVFLSNILGICDDLDKIREICDEKKILLCEDNCQSFGSVYKGTLLGNFGFASTFSFYVGHHLSSIEGGAICTDDEELYDLLVITRAHGWVRNLSPEKQMRFQKRYKVDEFFNLYTFYELGFNVRPTEITGFLALQSLQWAEEIVWKRHQNFLFFHGHVLQNPDFLPVDVSHMDIVSNFAYPLIAKNRDIFLRYRQRFLDGLVEIRPIAGGNMTDQPFFRKFVRKKFRMEFAELIHTNGFYFPNHPDLTEEEKEHIVSLLRKLD